MILAPRLLMQQNISRPRRIAPIKPPTMPPIMPALLDLDAALVTGGAVAVDVADRILVWPTILVASEVVVEVFSIEAADVAVVVVDSVVLVDLDVVEAVLFLVVESESSSGHIPSVQGSLEQHPVNDPMVQTYHSLPSVQLVSARGARKSILEEVGWKSYARNIYTI